MTRIALVIAYNGSHFHGWQLQEASISTVQQTLMKAIARIADHPVILHCAGRTDTGVHATKQIVHFDTEVSRPDRAWVMGTNTHLDENVSVHWASTVDPSFDARHSATARQYLYLIHNQRVRSSLMPDYLTRERRPLDADAMHEAAQRLLGENDFSSFRASNCQSLTPMRKMTALSVKRYGDIVAIRVTANAFLHHMVRNIAGVLMDIGAGERPLDWPTELLQAKDRTLASVTALPNGLFLIDVEYPAKFGLPQGPALPHVLQTF
jgi:tRNA pseudouridine38-40 synthase